MKIRNVINSDYEKISPLINEWWGGRQMSDMLPRLFFEHFNDTSFIAEENGKIIGFLIGFLSQSNQEEAYIHFVGVDPERRSRWVGKRLYEEFFCIAKENNRTVVNAVTSPVNKISIAYHIKMGFDIKIGDQEIDGVPVFKNYDGENQDRVLFAKNLS